MQKNAGSYTTIPNHPLLLPWGLSGDDDDDDDDLGFRARRR